MRLALAAMGSGSDRKGGGPWRRWGEAATGRAEEAEGWRSHCNPKQYIVSLLARVRVRVRHRERGVSEGGAGMRAVARPARACEPWQGRRGQAEEGEAGAGQRDQREGAARRGCNGDCKPWQ